MKQILKDWTLPISMFLGVLGYLLFTQLSFLHDAKEFLVGYIPIILPSLIFIILFFTYCKIEPKDFKPRRWHLWLILIQAAEVAMIVPCCLTLESNSEYKPLLEAILATCIGPMAAVGAVVTQKIGGNAATATSYTLISSAFTAIAVPLVYPIVEPGIDISFIDLFLKILSRVFPTIMVPLIIALLLWWLLPKVKEYLAEKSKDYSFYIWGICTMVNTAQIIRSIVNSDCSGWVFVAICISTCVIVSIHFIIGKSIGTIYNDRIAAGQGLAQKNTVLCIWMAMSFLNPQSAIGPGFCLLFQSVVNSWQIWDFSQKQKTMK